MATIRTLTATLAILFASSASAQMGGGGTTMNSKGNCNAQVGGSGNNVTVICNTAQTNDEKPDDDLLVAINFTNEPTIMTWTRDAWGNWLPYYPDMTYVNMWQSNYELELADSYYRFAFSERFEGDHERLKPGRHPFTMRVNVSFLNGYYTEARCKGVLNLKSAATLIPRFNVQVNPMTGDIAPIDCSFIATN